jgi:hypothetical protein
MLELFLLLKSKQNKNAKKILNLIYLTFLGSNFVFNHKHAKQMDSFTRKDNFVHNYIYRLVGILLSV